MVVFVTCKNDEDPIKNKGARVVTRLLIFQMLKADNSVVSGGFLRKFKLIQAFMVVLVTCKTDSQADYCKNHAFKDASMKLGMYFSQEEDSSKNEGTRWSQFSPLINLWGFFSTLRGS